MYHSDCILSQPQDHINIIAPNKKKMVRMFQHSLRNRRNHKGQMKSCSWMKCVKVFFLWMLIIEVICCMSQKHLLCHNTWSNWWSKFILFGSLVSVVKNSDVIFRVPVVVGISWVFCPEKMNNILVFSQHPTWVVTLLNH